MNEGGETEGYLTRAALSRLDDPALMAYLSDHWGLTEEVIYGRLASRTLASGNTVWIITGATNAAGQPLGYPVADLDRAFEELQNWVHIGDRPAGCDEGAYVRGAFELAPVDVRKRRGNPVAIGVPSSSVDLVRELGPSDVQVGEDGTLRIREALARQFVEIEYAEQLGEVEKLREERDRLVPAVEDLVRKRKDLEADVDEKGKELGVLAEETEAQRVQAERVLAQQKAAIASEFAQERATHQTRIEAMARQADRLRDFVEARADRLCRLGLITDEHRDELLLDGAEPPSDVTERPTPLTIPGGWRGVVPRVQRYLFEADGRRIVYPKALLEAFLALVWSGDLIVLSGLSGSGKTQLVRAFAEATGGVAHVIPVKPNWTSSEDLLGYYNPVQRAYLPTPFLDALIAAKRDPKRMHYVCLDEMNLARVEYYFADFLSAMEARGAEGPSVELYSAEEAGHVEAEFRVFVDIMLDVGDALAGLSIGELMREEGVAADLKERLGIGEGESLVEQVGRLRRMVSGVLNVPPRLAIPENVRVIGAVNIDETTHYLSPKVLDRAHVLRFDSPLDVWDMVVREVAETEGAGIPGEAVFLSAEHFEREDYPPYNPNGSDYIVDELARWREEYFVPLGLDFGLRTARQAVHFRNYFGLVAWAEDDEMLEGALTHVLRQKIFPRFSFDGKRPPRPLPNGKQRAEETCLEVVRAFRNEVGALPDVGPYSAARELDGLLLRAESKQADGIFNYWA